MQLPTNEDIHDPRAQRTRIAMIKAVEQLIIEDGVSAVTHQRVAELAGVGRATVYRHWPTIDDILNSVFELFSFMVEASYGEDLGERMMDLLRNMADQFAQPDVSAFVLAVSERSLRDPATERIKNIRMEEFHKGITRVLVESGMTKPDPDPDRTLMARLVGPIWFRVLIQGREASDAFITAIVESVIADLLPDVSDEHP